MYQTNASAFMLDGMKLILWFDRINKANARFHKFTHALFFCILIVPCLVIEVSSIKRRGKSNWHLCSALMGTYLKHVLLCNFECICRFEAIALLLSLSFHVNVILFSSTHPPMPMVLHIDDSINLLDTLLLNSW